MLQKDMDSEAILRQKLMAEALTASRKRKGKDKAAQGRGQELVGTEYASFSDAEPGMGDIQRFVCMIFRCENQ